jgi:hypothetical protein
MQIGGRSTTSWSSDSSLVQRWAMGWMIGGSIFGRGWEFSSLPLALEPTQPPIQWVPGALSLGGKAVGVHS